MPGPSSDLVFEVFCLDDEWPEVEYLPGRELEGFFPERRAAVQLNYGQGEGQILIDGCEWGFYQNERGNLDGVLHAPELSPSEASEVVLDVCRSLEKRYGVRFVFRLKGTP